MNQTDYSSVGDALLALKEVDKTKKRIFEYVRQQMRDQVSDDADVTAIVELKEFFDYINCSDANSVTLPNFKE